MRYPTRRGRRRLGGAQAVREDQRWLTCLVEPRADGRDRVVSIPRWAIAGDSLGRNQPSMRPVSCAQIAISTLLRASDGGARPNGSATTRTALHGSPTWGSPRPSSMLRTCDLTRRRLSAPHRPSSTRRGTIQAVHDRLGTLGPNAPDVGTVGADNVHVTRGDSWFSNRLAGTSIRRHGTCTASGTGPHGPTR